MNLLLDTNILLMTFNKTHFSRFTAIQAFTPAEIVSGQIPA